jgi:hypothetical protein
VTHIAYSFHPTFIIIVREGRRKFRVGMKNPLLIDEAGLKCFREVFQTVIELPSVGRATTPVPGPGSRPASLFFSRD